MAGTINYAYDLNQEVYVINNCEGTLYVIGGKVRRIRAEVHANATEVVYDVMQNGNRGTSEFEETDVFADKTSALAEYDTRLL